MHADNDTSTHAAPPSFLYALIIHQFESYCQANPQQPTRMQGDIPAVRSSTKANRTNTFPPASLLFNLRSNAPCSLSHLVELALALIRLNPPCRQPFPPTQRMHSRCVLVQLSESELPLQPPSGPSDAKPFFSTYDTIVSLPVCSCIPGSHLSLHSCSKC